MKERYFLVSFQDGDVCSVPRSKILEPAVVEVDQECTVKWHTGKKYMAKVLFIGELHVQKYFSPCNQVLDS